MTTQSSKVGRDRPHGAPGATMTIVPGPPVGVPGAAAVMTKTTGENFTVASRLLPAAYRRDLLALYGFARLVDDVGDASELDRGATLDWLDDELVRAADGRAHHGVFVNLTLTLRHRDLPLEPFRRLIAANRQDQTVTRYPTYDDLLEYCALSATPVGELVLRVFGVATPGRLELSDEVCRGLQVVEHLQDVREDLARGRIYLPLEDLDRFGCAETDLASPAAGANVRALIRYEAARARDHLTAGPRLTATLRGRMRIAVACYVAGGLAAVDAIDAVDGDVLGVECRPRPHRVVAQLASVLIAAARMRGTA
jgi:squalene synthase HpnC